MSNQSLAYARVVRRRMSELVQSLSIEQLNHIPQGFNNNIAWHFGHVLVSTQLLCYVRSGLQPEKLIPLADQYKNGTRPDAFIAQEEINSIQATILTSLDEIEADCQKGNMEPIQPYQTHTFGIQLQDIEEVLECCALHDTLHAGYMMSIKRLLQQA